MPDVAIMIREATNSDVETIVERRIEFLNDVRADSQAFPVDFEANTRAFVETEFGAGRLRAWLAFDGSAFAGIAAVLIRPRPPVPEDQRTVEAHVVNMYVPDAYQRLGVGKRLLDECLCAAGEIAATKVNLRSTDAGRALYQANQFHQQLNWFERAMPLDDE